MSCPCIPDYRGTDISKVTVIASLLSATKGGLITPPDGVRYFQRDLNELHSRGLANPYAMRPDRLWFYKLTEAGVAQRDSLLADGWNFDGFDAWFHETLMRAA